MKNISTVSSSSLLLTTLALGASPFAMPSVQAQGKNGASDISVRTIGGQRIEGLWDAKSGQHTRGSESDIEEMPRALTAPASGGSQATQWELAKRQSVKIDIKRSGWTRVTMAQLTAAGLDANASPASMRLFVEGREVPLRVPAKARLAATDAVEFYGMALDVPYTPTRPYWLVTGVGTNKPIPSTPSATPAAAPARDFFAIVQSKPRVYYFPAVSNGEESNFFGTFLSSSAATLTLPAHDVMRGGASTIAYVDVAFQPVFPGSHAVEVGCNGTRIGTVAWSGKARLTARLKMPLSLLQEGNNTLSFRTTAGATDFSLIDFARIIYSRQLRARDNRLTFTGTGGASVEIDGFTSGPVRVVDVTDPNAPLSIVPQIPVAGSVRLKLPGSGARVLEAFADGQGQNVEARRNDRSNLNSLRSGNDMIVVTPRAFAAALSPLVARRQNEGISVRLVDIEDIFDEWSFGVHSPQAIKSFLSFARANWATKPRWMMLAGDASYDAHDFFDKGDYDLVPTRLMDVAGSETASDEWLADLDGDGLGEVALGRLPARTTDELAIMVSKIVGYDATPGGATGHKVLQVSDRLSGYDFEGANDRLTTLLPPGTATQHVRRAAGDDATAHAQIIEAWNNSPLLVTYFGHGSVDLWTQGTPSLLAAPEAASLTNSQPLPVLLGLTCLNGLFQAPTLLSLSEALLLAPNGGAVGVWTSSGETLPSGQEPAARALVQALFPADTTTPALTLGEAIHAGKQATNDQQVRSTWILFGDPAMRVARPQPVSGG